jgi:hypothetical protein
VPTIEARIKKLAVEGYEKGLGDQTGPTTLVQNGKI